ncbi:molecular chaperone DnaJ [Patescibacteria group bacterium]|nr:molecular chaperone DnaJ [Patescibacteria group bacterium]
MSDYYSILGLEKNASDADIKKAYRKKAQEHHPDRNPDNPEAEKKFKEVQEAYETLSDKQKRSYYDQFGQSTGPGGAGFPGGGAGFDFNQFSGFADIFESFFGQGNGYSGRRNNKPGPVRGGDIQVEIQVKFEEAVFGTTKHLEITKPEECKQCDGNGSEPGVKIITCAQCGGQGEIHQTRQTILGNIRSSQVCPQCLGEGEVPEKKCTKCNGQMRVQETNEISVKIPKGVEDNTTIRLKEKGSAGVRGGPYGDLFLHVRVLDHNKFTRDGRTIFSEETVPLLKAVLGGEIKVDTVHGKEELNIPAGTQSETEFTIKGKGAPSVRTDKLGDHIVKVKIQIPTKLSKKEKELYRELSVVSGVKVKTDGMFSGLFE